MDAAAVRSVSADLPRDPGVYLFKGSERVLYVGKAVDLRSRVRSYVDPRSYRIEQMVRTADEIDIAITDTETQAILLEANLIKRHQPRYNVRLTDDKSYPLVQLTDHEFPRIEVTRDPSPGAKVWGPFTDKGRVDTVVKALRDTFGVRGCSDHKFANRSRPCLDYEVGLCTAPCTNEISHNEYIADVEHVERFLDGATGVLAEPVRAAMQAAAAEYEFERAGNLRNRLEAIEAFHGGAGDAVNSYDGSRTKDVLGAVVEGTRATVARLHSEGGKLVGRERHPVQIPATLDTETVIAAFIPQFYAERPLPDALVLSDHPGDPDLLNWLTNEGVDVTVPGTGRDAKIVDLALKNARQSDRPNGSAALANALGLSSIARIEGFDISHASGKATVGSNVVFSEGSPEKSGYRRKKLTERNDDYAAMRELIEWRAKRSVTDRDDRPDPDLLLVDGGRGQLRAAQDALTTVNWDIPVIALAKATETVITPDGEFDWADDAPHLHLLQYVRDEAHRFAQQYNQILREDVTSVLDDIPGIGPERRSRLLRRFGSVDGIRSASVTELEEVPGIGDTTATAIKHRLT